MDTTEASATNSFAAESPLYLRENWAPGLGQLTKSELRVEGIIPAERTGTGGELHRAPIVSGNAGRMAQPLSPDIELPSERLKVGPHEQ